MVYFFAGIVVGGFAVCGVGFYVLCLWSAYKFQRDHSKSHPIFIFTPPVSILKPLRGADPRMYESFRSHCVQDYPEYELIFGVSDPDDPAVDAVQQLIREFPQCQIRLMVCSEVLGNNRKTSNLAQMLSI